MVETFGLTAPEGFQTPWTDTDGRWYEQVARVAAFHQLFDFSHFDGAEDIDRAEFARVVVAAAGESCVSMIRSPGPGCLVWNRGIRVKRSRLMPMTPAPAVPTG